MAAKLQLSRAASTLRSATEACGSSVVAWQQLVDALSHGVEPIAAPSDGHCSSGHHAAAYVDQDQQFMPSMQQHQNTNSVLGGHAAAPRQIILHHFSSAADQGTGKQSWHWQMSEDNLQQQFHSSLAAGVLQQLQEPSNSKLCEYSSLPPNRGIINIPSPGAGGSSSSSNSSSGTKESKTASGSSAAAPTDSLAAALMALANSTKAAQLTPSAIMKQLDRHIVGQAVRRSEQAVSIHLLYIIACTGMCCAEHL